MKTLTENMINIFGSQGKLWLQELPAIIDTLSKQWDLSHIIPVTNMTYHYVAKALQHGRLPVILKIGCDAKTIQDELRALAFFAGNGAIQLLDHDLTARALLLQQAIPGTTLKSLYPFQVDYVMEAYLTTMQRLHTQTINSKPDFPHIRDWLSALDRVPPESLPHVLLAKAIDLKNELLASLTNTRVLHGDLHHDNILKHDHQWVAIDPKGILGDPEFEVAAFDFIHDTDLTTNNNIPALWVERTTLIAGKSSLDARRIMKWTFVRLLLGAAWSVEDNSDPRFHLNLAAAIAAALE